jgi:alkanesulfonate monooxygenase SsuD/methylene tetrahydromethanopterin reductase-like flavin-dependent oxidoreductase (luciferase family)
MDADTLWERGIIIAGNPESCIKTVQQYIDAGVNQVLMIMQTETIPHERVMRSLELFGKQVIPAFRGRDGAEPQIHPGTKQENLVSL